MSAPVTIELSAPIEAHDKTLTQLTFQPLRGKHLRRFASPVRITVNGGQPEIDTEACGALIAELAGIPISSVDQMVPADYVEACAVIVSFFARAGNGATPPSSSTSTSTVPASGGTIPASLS